MSSTVVCQLCHRCGRWHGDPQKYCMFSKVGACIYGNIYIEFIRSPFCPFTVEEVHEHLVDNGVN